METTPETSLDKKAETLNKDFTEEIQQRIVAMMFFDQEAFLKVKDIIKPDYFENPVLADLVRIILAYHKKYSQCIDMEELAQELDAFLDNSKRPLPREVYQEQFGALLNDGAVQACGKGFQYILDQVVEWTQYQLVKIAILKSINLLQKKRDYPGILKEITEAVSIGSHGQEDDEELHWQEVNEAEETEQQWLMPNRVPFNELTIWGGDPGAGKSYLSLWLAAHISAGIPWEMDVGTPEVGSVIILNTEDSIAIIRKRLRTNGADLKKCKVIDSVMKKDGTGERLFSLTRDLVRLKKKIDQVGDARLVIVDLLDTYLGTNIDTNKGSDITAVLAPLRRFAEQNHIAILGLMHLNKNQQSSFIYRLLGSVKIVGIPRTVAFVTKDRNDSRIRYYQTAKNNLTDVDWEELNFAFHKEKDGKIVPDLDADVPLIDDQVGPETKEQAKEKHKKVDEAITILRDLLVGEDAQEEVLVSTIKTTYPDIYNNAWGKARKELGIRSFPRDGVYWWALRKKGS